MYVLQNRKAKQVTLLCPDCFENFHKSTSKNEMKRNYRWQWVEGGGYCPKCNRDIIPVILRNSQSGMN